MQNKATTLSDSVADESSNVGQKLSDAAALVKDKASNLGRTAANKIDENREAAASGMDKTASALHEKADSLPGGEKVSSLAHGAAEKLSSTADYIREHDVKKMMANVERLVKNNPGTSLLVAAVIGFLLARAFTSND